MKKLADEEWKRAGPKERVRQGGGPFRDPCMVPRGGMENALAAASATFLLDLVFPACPILHTWRYFSEEFVAARPAVARSVPRTTGAQSQSI
jgi:hypothetical protein